MLLQINKKILIYIFLFIILGTLNNKNLKKIKLPKINEIEVMGLNAEENINLKKRLDLFKSQSLFFVNKFDLEKVLSSNNLIEKYFVFKQYPSSLVIKVSRTKFLAKTFKNKKIFYLGSNGKFTFSNKYIDELPFIFGDFKQKNFFNLFEIINETKFDYHEIKNLFFFNSGRWDIELHSGILIKLPREKLKESFNFAIKILNNDNFKNINILDVRQEGQVIING